MNSLQEGRVQKMTGLNTDAMKIIIELLIICPDRRDSGRLDKQSPSDGCISDAVLQPFVAQ
jgi:hypothetical protein